MSFPFVSKWSGVWGWWRGGDANGMYERVCLGEWGGRVEGEYVEKGGGGGEGRGVGCALSLSLPSLPATVFLIGVLLPSFLALPVNLIGLLFFLPTVLSSSKVSTASICGYWWHRSTVANKPSPLSAYLCACPAGTYCPSGALAASTPLTCTVGSYCPKGSTSMAPCPSGYYCPSPSSLPLCPEGVAEWDPG